MAGNSDRQEDAKVSHPSESHLEKATSHQILPANKVGLTNVQISLSHSQCLCVFVLGSSCGWATPLTA